MNCAVLLSALVAASFAAGLDLNESEEGSDLNEFEEGSELDKTEERLDLDEFEERLDLDEFEDGLDLDELEDELRNSPMVDINPGRSVGSVFRKACDCHNNICRCCTRPAIFGFGINAPGKSNFCGKMPSPVSFINFCLKTVIIVNESGDITMCGELDIKVKSITAVNLDFRCVEVKDGQISFSDEYVPPANGAVDVKARRGYKKVLNYLSRLQ